ncbi:WYL domain-containing protein [Kribbella sp. NBC_01245]|uniref:helix-turn-helix transcriptional regulator n=1 Tax=Kribbella sp. NBC_01245 TaxID=2903578 RepID=UPI002E2E77B1|nr:WYL domain-containing protein [Kribbella sp. NBC_01245]
MAKLEQVLPSRLRRRVNAMATYTVQVPADTTTTSVDPSLLTQLAWLCRDREQLRFDHRSHNGESSVRRVEPYRLVNWGRRWYLLAYDLDRQDWRTFRVERLAPRIPTGPRFTPRELPEGGDVAAYVSRGASTAAWRYQAKVIVHAPAERIAAMISPAAGTVEPIDDTSCLFTTGSDSLQSLAVHLGLLDTDFHVDGPPELVAHLTKLASRYDHATPS